LLGVAGYLSSPTRLLSPDMTAGAAGSRWRGRLLFVAAVARSPPLLFGGWRCWRSPSGLGVPIPARRSTPRILVTILVLVLLSARDARGRSRRNLWGSRSSPT